MEVNFSLEEEDISTKILIVQVDLMVCVTTSKTLLHSILAKAGPSIEAQFQPYYTTLTPIILPGGHTQARKILFAPWKLTTERWDSIRDKQVRSSIQLNIYIQFISVINNIC